MKIGFGPVAFGAKYLEFTRPPGEPANPAHQAIAASSLIGQGNIAGVLPINQNGNHAEKWLLLNHAENKEAESVLKAGDDSQNNLIKQLFSHRIKGTLHVTYALKPIPGAMLYPNNGQKPKIPSIQTPLTELDLTV